MLVYILLLLWLTCYDLSWVGLFYFNCYLMKFGMVICCMGLLLIDFFVTWCLLFVYLFVCGFFNCVVNKDGVWFGLRFILFWFCIMFGCLLLIDLNFSCYILVMYLGVVDLFVVWFLGLPCLGFCLLFIGLVLLC